MYFSLPTGSTLDVFNQSSNQDNVMVMEALEDKKKLKNQKSKGGSELELQLSETTRRASIAQVHHHNTNMAWQKKHEACTLELVQCKHRYDSK